MKRISQLVAFLTYFVGNARGKVCEANPDEIMQLTSHTCDCCVEPQKYLQQHEYVYLLFYTGVHANKMNADIFDKYSAFYKEWKHTNVAFGRVDVNIDQEFAKSLLEPNQIPTNILFRNGEPVVVATEDFKAVVSMYQGSPPGHRFLLNKYLGKGVHFAKMLESKADVEKTFRKKPKKSTAQRRIVGLFPNLDESNSIVRAFREAAWDVRDHKKADSMFWISMSTATALPLMEAMEVKDFEFSDPENPKTRLGKILVVEWDAEKKKWNKVEVKTFDALKADADDVIEYVQKIVPPMEKKKAKRGSDEL
ncbi:unnamed protein product [Amoebophrya sp. A25]|nr:unnamed protein product [Amoebophrya sp. A25]|eukprot:GSA25T00015263001.1